MPNPNPELDRLRDLDELPAWRRWGPYLSDRQWGTVREDYSPGGNPWAYFPFCTRAPPRVPLGRRRHRGPLRRRPAALPRPDALERTRPDSQGAAVRSRQRGGQPRRGREGAVLPPRRHADALVPEVPLQVPAGQVPVRSNCTRRTAAAGGTTPSSRSSTPASSTTTGTSTCSSSMPRPAHATS